MLSKPSYQSDKMAGQIRGMKNELERKLRAVTVRLEEVDTRLRRLEEAPSLVGSGLPRAAVEVPES